MSPNHPFKPETGFEHNINPPRSTEGTEWLNDGTSFELQTTVGTAVCLSTLDIKVSRHQFQYMVTGPSSMLIPVVWCWWP